MSTIFPKTGEKASEKLEPYDSSRFDPWVRKIPWRRKWHPTPVLLPGKFHGWRSLVGYSPWGHKESDTTEQLHFYVSTFQNNLFAKHFDLM